MTTDFESLQPISPATRLEPMLVRLPPALASELRNLARKTRVRQSDYLREAVADLLAKYGALPMIDEENPN
jgi:Arc/MetJ-type ribon-helix-helix transcriptional regulator